MNFIKKVILTYFISFYAIYRIQNFFVLKSTISNYLPIHVNDRCVEKITTPRSDSVLYGNEFRSTNVKAE